MASEPFAFDYEQQCAVLGHCFFQPKLWELLDAIGVRKEWFVDQRLVSLYDWIADFRRRHGRPPTPSELSAHVANHYDPTIKEAVDIRLRQCGEAARVHKIDVIMSRLNGWARLDAVQRVALEIKRRYDAGQHDGIENVVMEGATALRRMDIQAGVGHDRFISSPERIRGEEEDRIANQTGRLVYGIPFFDDALGGVFRKDLILSTARSGAGKTQGATIFAETNARAGKQIAVFALEAAGREIERRIKFQKMIDLWYRSRPDPLDKKPTWRAWFRGEPWAIKALDAPFRDEANAWYEATYPTLKTYYKEGDRFNNADLERHIIDISSETDGIVIDHFHYVEAKEDLTENKESNQLITLLRDLSIGLGIPLYVVCHINKAGDEVLVPDQQHIHGSSEVYKKATVVLASAPARDLTSSNVTGPTFSTYQRIAKDRVSPVPQIAVGFFDPRTGRYIDKYGIGYLNLSNTKWKSVAPGKLPEWMPTDRFVMVSQTS